jgi:hypothetical protein
MRHGQQPNVITGFHCVQVAETEGIAGGWGIIQPVESWRLLFANGAGRAGRIGDGGKQKGGEQHEGKKSMVVEYSLVHAGDYSTGFRVEQKSARRRARA